MIFLKSFAAGLIAVLATAVAIAVTAIVALFLLSARNQAKDTVIGWDPVEFGRAPFAWIIFLFAFAAGFYWQHRRLAAH
jgi:uncharacterized BrkB/YihY/UPF0761 family membrane protein